MGNGRILFTAVSGECRKVSAIEDCAREDCTVSVSVLVCKFQMPLSSDSEWCYDSEVHEVCRDYSGIILSYHTLPKQPSSLDQPRQPRDSLAYSDVLYERALCRALVPCRACEPVSLSGCLPVFLASCRCLVSITQPSSILLRPAESEW